MLTDFLNTRLFLYSGQGKFSVALKRKKTAFILQKHCTNALCIDFYTKAKVQKVEFQSTPDYLVQFVRSFGSGHFMQLGCHCRTVY